MFTFCMAIVVLVEKMYRQFEKGADWDEELVWLFCRDFSRLLVASGTTAQAYFEIPVKMHTPF
jgi:hypothetical protein